MRLTQPTKSTRVYLARQNALHKALKKFIRDAKTLRRQSKGGAR